MARHIKALKYDRHGKLTRRGIVQDGSSWIENLTEQGWVPDPGATIRGGFFPTRPYFDDTPPDKTSTDSIID